VDYTPVKGHPQALTFTASAPVFAGNTVRLSGHWTVAPTNTNDQQYIGVAGQDAETGEMVTVLCGAGVVHLTACHGPLGLETPVQAHGGGQIAEFDPAAGVLIGITCSSAADTEECPWFAYR
jgi:hypothetical protein